VAYPVSYRTEYIEKRSRLSVFFRWAMAIPVALALVFWAVIGIFTMVATWFALVFTGRYPPALYAFNSNVLRAAARFTGYLYLQTDKFPPLGLGEHPEYPIDVVIAPAQEKYSRLKVFFRALLAIPIYIVSAAFGYAVGAVVVAAWFVIVLLGRLPYGMFEAIDFLYGFTVRYYGYAFGMFTDRYPTFTDPPDDPQLPPGSWGPPPEYVQPGYPPQEPLTATYGGPPQPPAYPEPPPPPQEPPTGPYGGPPPG